MKHFVRSHLARLFGLVKVHKAEVPTRPVLSMPGSAYHKIALETTEWLAVVQECGINSSTKSIADSEGSHSGLGVKRITILTTRRNETNNS